MPLAFDTMTDLGARWRPVLALVETVEALERSEMAAAREVAAGVREYRELCAAVVELLEGRFAKVLAGRAAMEVRQAKLEWRTYFEARVSGRVMRARGPAWPMGAELPQMNDRTPPMDEATTLVNTEISRADSPHEDLPELSPLARRLVETWEKMAVETGRKARGLGMRVWDASRHAGAGGYRLVEAVGAEYFPRVRRRELSVTRTILSAETPLHDATAAERDPAAGKIARVTSAATPGQAAGRMARVTRATARPGEFYACDFDEVVPRFIASFAQRVARVKVFGQKLARLSPADTRGWDRFDRALAKTTDQATRARLESIRAWVDGIAAREDETSRGGVSTLPVLAGGTPLSRSWTTVPPCVLDGLFSPVEQRAAERSLAALRNVLKGTLPRLSARHLSIVREALLDAATVEEEGARGRQGEGESGRQTTPASAGIGETRTNPALDTTHNSAPQNPSPSPSPSPSLPLAPSPPPSPSTPPTRLDGCAEFTRRHARLTALIYAQEFAASHMDPATTREAEQYLQRLGIDAAQLRAEAACHGRPPPPTETRSFLRAALHHGRLARDAAAAPLWSRSATGRLCHALRRWGMARARTLWKQVFAPALFGDWQMMRGRRYRVRRCTPLTRWIATLPLRKVTSPTHDGAALTGEMYAALGAMLFDDSREDTSLAQVARTADGPRLRDLAPLAERAMNDVLTGGLLALLAQPRDFREAWFRGAPSQHPLEPSASAIPRTLLELLAALRERGLPVSGWE